MVLFNGVLNNDICCLLIIECQHLRSSSFSQSDQVYLVTGSLVTLSIFEMNIDRMILVQTWRNVKKDNWRNRKKKYEVFLDKYKE